jgi:hypothetical protein
LIPASAVLWLRLISASGSRIFIAGHERLREQDCGIFLKIPEWPKFQKSLALFLFFARRNFADYQNTERLGQRRDDSGQRW